MRYLFFIIISLILTDTSECANPSDSAGNQKKLTEIGLGYSKTSVNTAVFRTNSLATFNDVQYIAYYDPEGYVTVGKRNINSD